MENQTAKLDFTGKDIFIGIDTHKKSWNITVMMGVFSKTFSSPPNAELLRNFLSYLIQIPDGKTKD